MYTSIRGMINDDRVVGIIDVKYPPAVNCSNAIVTCDQVWPRVSIATLYIYIEWRAANVIFVQFMFLRARKYGFALIFHVNKGITLLLRALWYFKPDKSHLRPERSKGRKWFLKGLKYHNAREKQFYLHYHWFFPIK